MTILIAQAWPAPFALAAPSRLPAEVRAYVAKMDQGCRRAHGVRNDSPGLIQSFDLTGDGVADHLVDDGRYQCVGAASLFFAGHNGAAMTIFVGRKEGRADRVYEGYSHGVEVRREGAVRRVHVNTYGRDCSGEPFVPPPSFADSTFCTRPLNWDAANRRFVFAPLTEARPTRQ